jgi:hypothetical protein
VAGDQVAGALRDGRVMSYAPRDAIDWKTTLTGNHSPFVTKPKQFHSVDGESSSKRKNSA